MISSLVFLRRKGCPVGGARDGEGLRLRVRGKAVMEKTPELGGGFPDPSIEPVCADRRKEEKKTHSQK